MTPERARDMIAYDSDSLGRLLDAIAELPSDALATELGQRLTATFAHLCQARLLWLDRIHGESWQGGPVFPPAETAAILRRRHAEASARWTEYARTITTDKLARELPYASTDGSSWMNTVEDVLLHLFGHSLYHRGQLAHWLARLGSTPPATDYIFWTRAERSEG